MEDPEGSVVARAGGQMATAMLLSRILGLLRDTAMASAFGLGLQADAYNLAITIPDTLFMLIAGGGLSSAFIPVFSELFYTGKKKEAWKLFSVVTTVCSAVVLVLLGLAWAFAPQIAQIMSAGKTDSHGKPLTAEIVPMITDMGRILLPGQFAFLIGSILLGTLYARKQFLAPAIAPNVYNVGIIAGAIIGSRIPGLGIYGMPWGGVCGAMIGNLVLPIMFMAKSGSSYRPSFDLQAEGVKKFFVLLAPVILGFSLPSMVQIITNFFAGQYPEGSNVVLKFGSTLMQAPSGIFGLSLAMAALPVLTQFYATNRMDLYRDQMNRTLRTVIFLGLPSGAILLALAPEIVHLLYGYGKAAKATNLSAVVEAVQIYSFSVFAWCLQPVLMRGFFSVHKTFLPIAVSTVMTLLFIISGWVCTSMHLPYMGLAWATDVCALILVVALYVMLERTVGALDRKGLSSTLVKSAASAAVMGVLAFGIARIPERLGLGGSHIIEAVTFLVVLFICAWIYYFAARALKMPEVSYFDRAMAKIQKRAGRR